MDELQRLCVAAKPLRAGAGRDLEAELLKARVLAGLSGDRSAALECPRLGRFEVLRWLGRGGMGSVFEAREHAHDERLALKVLNEPDSHGLARLRREFRSLADISHAGLVTLGELYEEAGLPFFTMELVPGRSLQQLIESAESWDIATLEHWLAQLISALSTLHARGVAHGDIKPSNLMVRPDGRLVVVDFGVAHVLAELDELRARRGSGTLAYMAPERVRGAQASPQADWYAVGAVLRELIARTQDDARSQELRRVLPGLLDPSPQRRFAAKELARAMRVKVRAPLSLQTEDDGVFVGRESELSALVRVLSELDGRGAYLCRVRGEPGIGKTALLEQFATVATAQGAWVLSGRCYEHENTRFKGFDLVIDGFARQLCTSLEREGDRLSPAEQDALVQAFPSLARAQFEPPHSARPMVQRASSELDVLAPPEHDSHSQAGSGVARAQLGCAAHGSQDGTSAPTALDSLSQAAQRGCGTAELPEATRTMRQLVFAGLAGLLRAVAVQRKVVIILDDWQWADADGLQLLEYLLAAGSPCLVVISQREGFSVAARAAQLDLELLPMSDADATQLVQALSEQTLPEARAALTREAGGSPLVLRALLRARPPGGRMRDYNALVGEVMSELDDDARELLRLAALAGQPVSLELLASAARLPSRPWQAVARLKNLRLLRSVVWHGNPALAPHHDRVREAVSGALEREARRAGHAALAHASEQLGVASEAPGFAAEQHLRAGHLPQAAFFAELAGDRARASAALEQARSQYARALQAHAPARPAQLVAKLADAAALVGDVQRAAPLLLEAAERLPEQAQSLQLKAAEMFLLAGQAARGMELLNPALRAQGIWLPSSERTAGLLGALSLLRLQLSRSHERRVPAMLSDPRIETTFRLGFLFQLTLPMHGYRLLLWSTERALHYGTVAQRARALAQLAVTQKALGLGTLAAQDLLLEQALTATSSDAVEHTFVLACKILVAFAQCDCAATLACVEQTRRFVLQHRVPVDWVLGPVTAVEVSTRVLAGQFAELRASQLEVERESQALGNRALSMQVDAAHAWAELAQGNADAMRAFSERALREWAGSQPLYGLALWAEAHRRLYCGELAGAAELLRVEQPRYARAGISRVQSWSLALTLLWGTIALRLSCAPDDAYASAARRYLRALCRARGTCAAASAALLEAGIHRLERDHPAACAAYERACRGFAALGMSGYAAATAYRIAELRRDHAAPAHADPWFRQQHIADPAAWTSIYAP